MRARFKLAAVLGILTAIACISAAPIGAPPVALSQGSESVVSYDAPQLLTEVENFSDYANIHAPRDVHHVGIPYGNSDIYAVLQNSADSPLPGNLIQTGGGYRGEWLYDYNHGPVLRYPAGNSKNTRHAPRTVMYPQV